jgi:hypothetical protein
MSTRSEIKSEIREGMLDVLEGVIDDDDMDLLVEDVLGRLETAGMIDVEEDDPDFEIDATDEDE